MRSLRTPLAVLLLLLIAAAAQFGCSSVTVGQKLAAPLPEVPPEKAVLYVYRLSSPYECGAEYQPEVTIKRGMFDRTVVTLAPEQYCAYIYEPKKITVSAEVKMTDGSFSASTSWWGETEPGKSRYIRLRVLKTQDYSEPADLSLVDEKPGEINACVFAGVEFCPVKHLAQDKAVVYIYRLSTGDEWDEESLLEVKANDEVVCRLAPGQYYPHIYDPDKIKISTAIKDVETQVIWDDTKPGESRYLRVWLPKKEGILELTDEEPDAFKKCREVSH